MQKQSTRARAGKQLAPASFQDESMSHDGHVHILLSAGHHQLSSALTIALTASIAKEPDGGSSTRVGPGPVFPRSEHGPAHPAASADP